MAWSLPSSFAVGEVLTAATMNLLRTSLGFLGSTTSLFVAAQVTATTTTFATKTGGPAVTVITGANALVIVNSTIFTNTSNDGAMLGFKVSGATTIAATQTKGQRWEGAANFTPQFASITPVALTAGSNTFTCQYRRLVGGTAGFTNRSITVIPLP